MNDRELLTRMRAITAELDRLIEAAEANSKYYTKSQLVRAHAALSAAAGSLAWHAGE